MAASTIQNETIRVTGLSNREFLELYAQPGRVGLSGGITLVDKAICRAERHLDEAERWGSWSHAFLFQGERHDGHHWVIESDLQFHRKHIQLGVQENRVSKYFDEKFYTTLAVLDFGLSGRRRSALLLREGLELVATRARYSLRELFGTLIALRHPELRGRENLLARERSLYCSAFVQHLFRKSGLDLAPGVDVKNTTPEDISRTSVPHVTYLLQRETGAQQAGRIEGSACDAACARASGVEGNREDLLKELRLEASGEYSPRLRLVSRRSSFAAVFGSGACSSRFERRVVDAEVVLRGFVALARGAAEPFHRLAHVLFDAAAGLVAQAEVALRRSDFLLGGEAIPLHGLLVILRHDLARLVEHAEVELRLRFAAVRRRHDTTSPLRRNSAARPGRFRKARRD